MQNILTRNSLLSMISAPVIWTAHFVLSYVIVSLACAGLGPAASHPGNDVGRSAIGLLTLAAVMLLGYIAFINHMKWRRSSSGDAAAGKMNRFFALCSVMLCAVSTVALIWVALPTYHLPLCAN